MDDLILPPVFEVDDLDLGTVELKRLQAGAFPRRERGHQSPEKERADQSALLACATFRQIKSTLDFDVSSRGWCYLLEGHVGLLKGDFDPAQKLINECRKSGMLPLAICAEDERRSADGLEDINDTSVEEQAGIIIGYVRNQHVFYTPISFWEDQEYYIEMAVEKIDLKSLFAPVCAPFRIPIRNVAGWSDITRAAMMKRFAYWEARGKKSVLLYFGDFDPGGLHISDFPRSNLADLQGCRWMVAG